MGAIVFNDHIQKLLLYGFNFLVVVGGIAILVGGSILLTTSNKFAFLLSNLHGSFETPRVFLLFIGTALFFTAFFGCCGTLRGSKNMLLAYVLCVFIIFVLQSCISLYAVLNFSKIEKSINNTLRIYFDQLEDKNDGSTEDALRITTTEETRRTMNDTQVRSKSNRVNIKQRMIFNQKNGEGKEILADLEIGLRCCGIHGPQDYKDELEKVPMTCCVRQDTLACGDEDTYKTGCVEAATEYAAHVLRIVPAITISMSILEVIAMLLACAYSKDVSRYDW